jgi:hypothetical protein
MMVVLGELGGGDEYSLVEALKQGKVNKPVVAWVSGTCARLFKSEVQFGHTVSGCPTILQVRNRAMLACQCLPLLNRVMAWVMSSLFYGSSAAFHFTIPILWRYVSHKCMTFIYIFNWSCRALSSM